MATVTEQVRAVMTEILQCSPHEVSDDMTMKETEAWDSLKHMELVVGIEETFSIQLSFDEIVTMVTMSGIQKIVASKINGD